MTTTDDLRRSFADHEHLAPDPAQVLGAFPAALRRRRRRGVLLAGTAAGVIAAVALPVLMLGGASDLSRPDQPAASQPPASMTVEPALIPAPPLDLPTFPVRADPPPVGTPPEVLWLSGDKLALQYREADAALSYSVELSPEDLLDGIEPTEACQGRPILVFEDSGGGGPVDLRAIWTLADGRTAELRAPASASEVDLLAFCESLVPVPLPATVGYDLDLVPVGWSVVASSAVQLMLAAAEDPSGPQIVVGLQVRTLEELGGRTVSIGDRFGRIIQVPGVGQDVVLPLDADRELRVTIPDILGLSDGELLTFVAGITVLPGAVVAGS